MVDRNDDDNAAFKSAALEGFRRSKYSTLVIAVDADKFVEPTEKHQPVIGTEKWSSLLEQKGKSIVVVTCPMRQEADVATVVEFERELEKFRSSEIVVDCGDRLVARRGESEGE